MCDDTEQLRSELAKSLADLARIRAAVEPLALHFRSRHKPGELVPMSTDSREVFAMRNVLAEVAAIVVTPCHCARTVDPNAVGFAEHDPPIVRAQVDRAPRPEWVIDTATHARLTLHGAVADVWQAIPDDPTAWIWAVQDGDCYVRLHESMASAQIAAEDAMADASEATS